MRRTCGSHSGDDGGDKSICDSTDQPLCQLINYTTTIHIELILSMEECDDEHIQDDIQCDINEPLSAALADLTETSSIIMPCTVVNDSGMDCIATVSVLNNSTVSQILTRQLFELLMNNRTLVGVSITGTIWINIECHFSFA